ncbi:MAG: hypothetical protein L6301_09500 [Desulfobacteraceae bacterium]|nr:hypothetical protein [Desulfobacteraceae bacterium]
MLKSALSLIECLSLVVVMVLKNALISSIFIGTVRREWAHVMWSIKAEFSLHRPVS